MNGKGYSSSGISALYPMKKTVALLELWESSNFFSKTTSKEIWGILSLESVPMTNVLSSIFK